MNYSAPSRWSDQLWRAVLTVLAAAVGVHLAWRLLSAVWPGLVMIVALLLVLRLAWARFHSRSDW